MIVSLVHIREAWTSREVLAVKWVLWEEVDMVVDNHKVTNLEIWVHATRSITYEESLDTQFIHNTLRECYFFHIVTLIEMETSLHSHDVFTTKFTEYQLSCVAFNSRNREIRNLTIWEFVTVSYF